MKPSVSVIVPTYRASEYIGAALQSVLAQTRPPAEIIVVDDASGDETAAVAHSFGSRVTVIEHPRNQGPGAARNTGVTASSGDYVAFLDADDLWHPEHLAELGTLLDVSPEAGLAFCRVELMGSRSGLWPQEMNPDERPRAISLELLRQNMICMSSMVVRRKAVQWMPWFEIYDEYHKGRRVQAEDYGFTLHLSLSAPFTSTARSSVSYRWHEQQSSQYVAPQIIMAYRHRLDLLNKIVQSGDREMIPQAEDRIRLAWEEDLERIWETRDTSGLRQMVVFGSQHELLSASTRAYRMKSLLPGWFSKRRTGRSS